MLIKPKKPETVIRNPSSRAKLPPYGGRVPDKFGARRILDGDAEETTEQAIAEGRSASREAAKAAQPAAVVAAELPAEAPKSKKKES